MRLVVAGDIHKPVLLDTDKFSGLLIKTDDGIPAVIYKITPDGKGFVRFTRGEDKNFDTVARQLGFSGVN